jgi:hypothetical protein
MDHRKDFQWLALEKLGKQAAESVDWSAPRLICIAGDFNRYDDHAVRQMQRHIELIRYRRFGQELVMLDLVTATASKGISIDQGGGVPAKYKTISAVLKELDVEMLDRVVRCSA